MSTQSSVLGEGWAGVGGVHHVTWLFVSINDPVIVPLTAGIGTSKLHDQDKTQSS